MLRTWEECANANMTLRQAATALGRSISAGRKYAKLHGIKFVLPPPRGQRCDKDDEIRRLYEGGMGMAQIGAELGMCRHAVRTRVLSMKLKIRDRKPKPEPKEPWVNPNTWKQWEIDFLRENYLTLSDDEMSKALMKRTVGAVIRARLTHGLAREEEMEGAGPPRPRRPRGISKEQRAWAIEHFSSDNPALREEARMIAVMAAEGTRTLER